MLYGAEADVELRLSGERAVWWRETEDGDVLRIEGADGAPELVAVTGETGVWGNALAAAVGAVFIPMQWQMLRTGVGNPTPTPTP